MKPIVTHPGYATPPVEGNFHAKGSLPKLGQGAAGQGSACGGKRFKG